MEQLPVIVYMYENSEQLTRQALMEQLSVIVNMYEDNTQRTGQALSKLPSVLVNMYEEKMGTMGLNPQGDSEQLEMMGKP